jgi:amino acid adenylation domain-containing protein
LTALTDLLTRLKSLDIRLTLDGERLNVSAPKGALNDALRAELSSRKEEIKALLREALAADQSEPIPRVERGSDMPVSHTQQRLWFMKQMEPTSSTYNVANSFRMEGQLHTQALEQALRDLVTRHESLRTRFITVEGRPRCVIETQVAPHLEHIDISHLPESQREAEAERVVAEVARRPILLERAPLMRLVLVRVDARVHYFCFVFDHIVCDGLSIGIFVVELQALYAQYVTGQPANLPPMPVQYLDYAEWQRRWLAGGALAEHLAYWKEQLRPLSSSLQLPTDRHRPKLQTFNGARLLKYFPPQLSVQLKALARAEGATLYMVLLAAFKVLLYRYSGDELIAVGSATANRNRPEVDRVIGFFANNVVMLGDLSRDPTVREMLGRVKDTALKAYAHQNMPFDVLVDAVSSRRELDHSPLFQVMFVLHSLMMDRIDLAGLNCKLVELDIKSARFDLSVDVFDVAQGLRVYFEYNTDLFNTESIDRMMDHFQMVLEGFVADPGARIRQLPLLRSEERVQLTRDWNRTETEYPRDATVHGLFEAQARRTPQAEAVRFGDASLTYEQLDRRANRLANRLQALDVRPESLVGVCVERSLDMVVALLGVLKAGAAYVPLDPAFPKDRLEFMIRDASLKTVVTQSNLMGLLDSDVCALCVDTQLDNASDERPQDAVATSADSIAYVIYTSGSTGQPKGVQLEHRSVVNFLSSMHRQPGIDSKDIVLSVTTLSFDIAGLEIFGPLTAGGSVVIADRATALDGQRLMALIDESDATVMQATPATWRLLFEAGWEGKSDLKILCGGEALPRDLADRLLDTADELWNMYGPTETTIWSTIARVTRDDRPPHIGRPIANTRVYILDPERQPTPVGVPGEIYIGGDGVARGYLGRPELTQERFVPDPFDARTVARMYRTGDLGRWRPDGTIECLGRVDQQVKIRGYRIEPGEIEVQLAKHPEVTQAAVVARPDASGEQRLIAYVVGGSGTDFEPASLRRFLGASVPDYMIPSVFVTLPALPLTPNGKIDRKALPAPEGRALSATATYASPQNEAESSVAAIWQEVLRVERVGRHDNFFDLGGHSLLVVQVQTRMQKRFSRKFMLIDLFQHPTVASLAEFIANGDGGTEEIELARERAGRQRAVRGRSEALN